MSIRKSLERALPDNAGKTRKEENELEVSLPEDPNLAQENLDEESKANAQAPRNGDHVAKEI